MNLMLPKTIIRLISMSLLLSQVFTIDLKAQYIPGSLNYQAVARDSQGQPLGNVKLTVQISINSNDANGETVWREDHQVETNTLGLFTLNIGSGHKTGGSALKLTNINWGKSAHFLKVEVDFGNGLIHMGTTQMMAVPYALYAEKAGNSSPDFSGFLFDPTTKTLKNEGTPVANLSSLSQSLEFDPSNYHLSISGTAGIIDLRQFIHAPQDLRISNNKIWLTGNRDSTIVDLSPYKQNLQVNAESKLEISNGNAVKIDTSNTNEIQNITLAGNKLSLSKTTGEVTIDASETNEIQDLQLAANKISLTKSAARAIPIDTSNVNEIQDLSLAGNALKITQNPSATSIDLTKYLDDTDKQTLSRSGSYLVISGGNQLDVSEMINLTWVGFSGNNLSGQALPGLAETLITWSEEFDSGNVLDNNRFIAPTNGFFNLSFSLIFLVQNNVVLKVYRNNVVIRTFDSFGPSFSHTMLLNLTSGETISIKVTNSSPSFTNSVTSGYFSGFRVN